MKFGNVVRVETYDINKDYDTVEPKFLQPSMRLRYNYYIQLVVTKQDWMRVPNFEISQRSGRKLVADMTVENGGQIGGMFLVRVRALL